ncbi:MAG: DnaJ domain-containing protein [Armatimonas sp.]
MELDPYRILNVPRDASPEQIRRQFRECVKAHHPDQGAGPESVEKLRRVVQAYHTLTQRESDSRAEILEGRSSDLITTAEAYLNSEEFEPAEVLGRMAIKDNPGSSIAYIVLARALLGLNRPAEAIGCYSLALQLDPENLRARQGLHALRHRETSVSEVA